MSMDAHDSAKIIFKLMGLMRPVFEEATPELKPRSLEVTRHGDDVVVSILLTPKTILLEDDPHPLEKLR